MQGDLLLVLAIGGMLVSLAVWIGIKGYPNRVKSYQAVLGTKRKLADESPSNKAVGRKRN